MSIARRIARVVQTPDPGAGAAAGVRPCRAAIPQRVSSYLEVLEAQRGLFNAKPALRQVQRQYLVATVQPYRALRGSWAEAGSSRDGG